MAALWNYAILLMGSPPPPGFSQANPQQRGGARQPNPTKPPKRDG
jgi:hypothetical protein